MGAPDIWHLFFLLDSKSQMLQHECKVGTEHQEPHLPEALGRGCPQPHPSRRWAASWYFTRHVCGLEVELEVGHELGAIAAELAAVGAAALRYSASKARPMLPYGRATAPGCLLLKIC